MNKVIISGNLCQNTELRMTPSQKVVAINTVAVRREFKNPSGEYDVDFINIVCWGNQANYLEKYANKGDRVEVVGRWQNRSYEYNGNKREISELIVESISAFSRTPKEQPAAPQDDQPFSNNFAEIDEDLPF